MSDAATLASLAIPDTPIAYEIIPGISYQDQLFTRERVANWLGIHRDTLGIWERQQRGPKVTRVGRAKIRYRLGDILQWLSAQQDAAPEARRKGDTRSRRKPGTAQSATTPSELRTKSRKPAMVGLG
jgi:hypothetical protein